jgi:hypothetical protein
MFKWLTIEALLKGMLEWVIGFWHLAWIVVIRPYWWFWLIVAAIWIVMRFRRR